MSDENQAIDPMEILIEESTDENLQIQVGAIQKLPTIAVALDVEKTRSELIPYLEKYLEDGFLHDEVLLTVAEQLETFLPFVGGAEHVDCIFKLLEKLCISDETLVRERAVESLVSIASNLDGNLLETQLIPLIERLANEVWFTSKCAASGLFTVCYPKVSSEHQATLRELYCSMMQDTQPMVRRTVATNLVNFASVLELQHLKEIFIPVLDTLIQDNHDSLRVIAVNVAVSFAEKLTDDEKETLLLKTFEALAVDIAWRVRCKVASCIDQIQKALGPKISKRHLITMYQNLCKDDEAQVREEAAKNIVKFCETLREYCENEDEQEESFENLIKEEIVPLIKILYEDKNDYVRAAIAWYVMPFCSLIDPKIVQSDLLPLVKYTIEHEQYPLVKENIARNLDTFIKVMGMSNVMDSIQKLMEDLIYTSDSKWRIRRDVLLTFLHVCKQCTQEFFNERLKDIYIRLLYDPVFAVRKTAPLILPILIKYFGTSWAYGLVPTILAFAQENNYLRRYIPIFAIDEIVEPSLDTGRVNYLDGLKQFCFDTDENTRKQAVKVLVKTKILHRLLSKQLEEDWVEEYKEKIDTDDYPPENIKMYAEDIYDAFIAGGNYNITKVEALPKEDEETYIAGVLFMCNKYFLEAINRLLTDDVINVTIKAKLTLLKIIQLARNLDTELKEDWVEEVIGSNTTEKEIELLEEEIKLKINPADTKTEEEHKMEDIKLDFTLQETPKEEENKTVGVTNEVEENIAEAMEGKEESNLENEIVEIFDSKLESISKSE